jgi:hypothetical protein
MSLGTRPKRGNSGPPAWLVFLLGAALVFGAYYVWLGVRDFLRTGGLGVVEATNQAIIISSATAERVQSTQPSDFTPLPTFTPIPPCQEFVVSVPNAIVRERPSTGAPIVDSLFEGTTVCVLEKPLDSEWYAIDTNPITRHPELAYMHEDIIQAVNPTLTPTETFTPPPTVTSAPTDIPTPTPLPRPTATRDPRVTDTPTPTLTPSATLPLVSA